MDTNARTKTIHFPHLLHLIGSSLSSKMFIHYYLANNVSFFVSFYTEPSAESSRLPFAAISLLLEKKKR